MATYKHADTGNEKTFEDGSFLDELAADDPKWQLVAGQAPKPAAAVAPEPAPEPVDPRPSAKAPKDEWVAYAIDIGIPSYEASNLSKPELIKRIEGNK